VALQLRSPGFLNILHRALQRLQGLQPYRHLRPGCGRQQHQQHRQRQRQHAREPGGGRLCGLQVGSHHQAPARCMHALCAHRALQHQQGRALRTILTLIVTNYYY
jgi:hypothetical protein